MFAKQFVLTAAGWEEAVHLELVWGCPRPPEKDAPSHRKEQRTLGKNRAPTGLLGLWTFAQDPLVESEPQLVAGGDP